MTEPRRPGADWLDDGSSIYFRRFGTSRWTGALVLDDRFYEDADMVRHTTLTTAGSIAFGVLEDNTCSPSMEFEVSFEIPAGAIDDTAMLQESADAEQEHSFAATTLRFGSISLENADSHEEHSTAADSHEEHSTAAEHGLT